MREKEKEKEKNSWHLKQELDFYLHTAVIDYISTPASLQRVHDHIRRDLAHKIYA